ncbi:MAG TPA: glycosyltransferase family A protein [Flavobacterium sp.]|jgi:glycosyltransferase involved in cell wall biosynthesis
MKSITVFTPTFNRAYCLKQLYDSLLRQTSADFTWLIIDDGSSDGTQALVESWINEQKVDIRYLYQNNHGMHSAHNTAYKNIQTALNVCIDSDDFMPDNAIALILERWAEVQSNPAIAGIIGLDASKDSGTVVGTGFPDGIRFSTLSELYRIHGVKGDKKLVLRTEVVRKFPLYPLFEGEKLVPLGTLYHMIGQQYKFFCVNDIYCIVEYLPDGSSNNIMKQYKKSPQGFRYARALEMKFSDSFSYTFSRAMHFVSSTLFIGDLAFFRNNPKKMITLLALPFGLALHLYILLKINESPSNNK